MPSLPAGPLAVDLGVLKTVGTEATNPVTFSDVETALYALTGWQKPQRLVDAMLDVVEAYARGARAGRVAPRRSGHLVVACGREHLDGHQCPVTVKTEQVERVVDPCEHGCRDAAAELTRLGQEMARAEPLPATDGNAPCTAPAGCVVHEGCPRGCKVAKFEASEATAAVAVEPEVLSPRSRYDRSMTPDQLLDDGVDVARLTPAQRKARLVLLAGEQMCVECGKTKPLAAFYKDKAKLTGRMSKCSGCSNAAAQRRKAAAKG